MKISKSILALLPLLAVGCAPTRIVTVAPSQSYSAVYTTVTAPMTRTVTKTEVFAVDEDICLQLDLKAVAAAFAQSSNVQEFESLLNNSSYMLSNLDLNRDGYVDYLRVLETVDRGTHVFLIQAVLAQNVFQDVATLIAEVSSVTNYHVQVVGAPYIYGANYIIQPVFVTRPMIFTYLVRPSYNPWRSPWYWSHFPSYYRHPAPIHLNHYMAYVDTYMRNHHYCHSCSYASTCHYPNYQVLSKPYQRNDYGAQHPEMSFSVRTSKSRVSTSTGGAATPARAAANARDIAEIHNASTVTTVTPARTTSGATTSRSATASKASATSGSTSTATSRSTSASTPSRSTSTATTPSRSTSTATTPSRSTSTSTTPARSSSTTGTSTPAPSRSASATPARSASSTSGTSSSSSNAQTTRSRVTSSGAASTKVSSSSSSGTSSGTATRSSGATRSSSATRR